MKNSKKETQMSGITITGYCVDEVSAWAYIPRQIEIELMIENELLKAQEEEE